jgi:hypothetical protein
VLVLVSTPSTDILQRSAIVMRKVYMPLTDLLAWGLPGMYWTDWKLKGLRALSVPLRGAGSLSLVPLKALAGVCGNVALVGLKAVVGVARCDKESPGANVP